MNKQQGHTTGPQSFRVHAEGDLATVTAQLATAGDSESELAAGCRKMLAGLLADALADEPRPDTEGGAVPFRYVASASGHPGDPEAGKPPWLSVIVHADTQESE